jgi:hypothetical protein
VETHDYKYVTSGAATLPLPAAKDHSCPNPAEGARTDLDSVVRRAQREAARLSEERRDLFLEHVILEDETEQKTANRQRRWKQFRELANVLAETLRATRFAHLADKVASCHTVFQGFCCDDCAGVPFAEPVGSCTIRLCPFEMRSRGMRALHRFRSAIEDLREGKCLVLAERNCGLHELGEGIDSLFTAFSRLRKASIWSKVRGAIAVLEITYNRETQSWHPHLNIVLDGPYMSFGDLVCAWGKATEGRGRTAFIREADRGTAVELLKYVTKLFAFIDVPEAVEEFLSATRRRRFIRMYGSLYNLKVEDEQNDCVHQCCPDCGSTRIHVIASVLLPQQVYFDSAGVVRIKPWALENGRSP